MKKLFYILIVLIGLSSSAFSQNKILSNGDAVVKILKIYPIPATSVINFDFQRSYDRSSTLQIFNFPGKLMYEITNLPSKINVPLTQFYRGLYFFKLNDKNGKTIESGRFLITK